MAEGKVFSMLLPEELVGDEPAKEQECPQEVLDAFDVLDAYFLVEGEDDDEVDLGEPGSIVTMDDGRDYVNISNEASRCYRFIGSEYVEVCEPVWLHASPNGHRIVDAEGFGHYIPLGWIHLVWEPSECEPTFVA